MSAYSYIFPCIKIILFSFISVFLKHCVINCFACKVNAYSFRLFISTCKHTVNKFFVTLHIGQTNGILSKKPFCFAKFYSKFAAFLRFFSFLAQKMLKITITTSIWGAQHPNAVRNIQHSINKQYHE